MITKSLLALFVVAAVGCGGEEPMMNMVDAAGSGSQTACTGAVFDPCTDNSQCMSNNCHFFMQNNFTVCITSCTPLDNSTCPVDSSGNHATCNMMGLCKPAAANNCTR